MILGRDQPRVGHHRPILRADPRGARTPVLVLTAKGQAADRERMTTLGADMFLTKPFSNKELIDSALALAGAAQ